MKRLCGLVLCFALLLSATACSTDGNIDSSGSTLPSSLDDVLDYLESNTTLTKNPDGTTTVTLSSGTENPTVPPVTTRGWQQSSVSVTRKPTTTKKRTTTTDDGRSTVLVTLPTTTTTTAKPAPIPTMIPTTKKTTTTTKAPRPDTPTSAGQTSTTAKKPAYSYTSNQEHTWLPLEQRYLYSFLNEEWKGYYRQIDDAVRHLDASVFLNADLTSGGRYHIYHLYMMDNPDLFFLSTSVTIYSKGDGQTGFIFSYAVGNKEGEYCRYGSPLAEINDDLRAKIRAKQNTFLDAVYAITHTIPSNAPAPVKERLIYDRLLLSSNYNLSARWDGMAEDNWTAYGIMVNGAGVCESYSEAFQTLCHAVGINCTGIIGDAGGGHKWNAVRLDGDWYQCDITFDDPIGGDPNDAYHMFFNLTSEEMKAFHHNWDHVTAIDWENNVFPTPNCTATKYNWENYLALYGE